MDLYAGAVKLPGPVIFDPFMGSGTTVGEAHKLGCTVIGRDINPVAWRAVRTALAPVDRARLLALFAELEATAAPDLKALHTGRDGAGAPCEVLYWFWVKQLDCPDCGHPVDLFASRIFARHAYVKRFPGVQVVCPHCGEVFPSDINLTGVACPACRRTFDPHAGAAAGANAHCATCRARFPIARTARARGEPPRHRLYAKLVLRADGTKGYKGEGTGAVRHMFSHHVLKPERTPIEANLWGTPKSSGSCLNLFQSRLLRAVDYKAAPFELTLDQGDGKPAGRKLFGRSRPMGAPVLDAWPAEGLAPGAVYLSCGDSAATDIPDRCVDAVVTDVPVVPVGGQCNASAPCVRLTIAQGRIVRWPV